MPPIPINRLSNLRVALVYSFEAPDEPSDRWYDRWRTRVIMSYGEALERISVHPYYCDIDTFCAQAVGKALPGISAVISLNAGVRPISNFALVPTVATWCNFPIIPSRGDVVIAGERKDLASLVANHCGLRLPPTFTLSQIGLAKAESRLVVKPRDLGGSVGVKVISGGDITEADFLDGQIVQAFVPGYDVTIPMYFDYEMGSMKCGYAAIYLPDQADPTSWFYSREAKEAYVGGAAPGNITRVMVPVSRELSNFLVAYCDALGIDGFGRIDFRLAQSNFSELMELGNDELRFLEVNPMPTVCSGLAFVEGIRHDLRSRFSSSLNIGEFKLDIENDYDVIAFVLGNVLLHKLHPAKVNNRD